MHKKISNDLILVSIEDAHGASKRVRMVLFVLLLGSVLAFSGFWNSRQNSWQNARIANLMQKLEYLENESDYCKTAFSKERLEYLERIKASYDKRHKLIKSPYYKKLEKELLEIIRLYCEYTVHFTIPILGIHFDTNDLCLMSGLTLTILMLLMFYSYNRELQALRISQSMIFKEFVEEKRKYFLLLSNSQILAVPILTSLLPDFPPQHTLMKILKYVPKILFFIPLSVYFCIYINDLKTYNYGDILNRTNSLISVTVSTTIIIFLILISIVIIITSFNIDKLWKRMTNDLIEIEEKQKAEKMKSEKTDKGQKKS